ncbi:DEAD/DEAH box helicase [Salipaludibacillus sp. CUR1]|uniref:DEAD/DEAH box helicase n=1 Tax=Salipaludibacillus sp. CUR1 TaxID=2820003 RepID=UPI001E4CCE3A|nr:DEAD/DEAH box helicase [Salipaludibacillus sp. CUR1]MCE7792716.1 DEAD/DEAH box helicase [Salipaludibacillus sp. CUR1]
MRFYDFPLPALFEKSSSLSLLFPSHSDLPVNLNRRWLIPEPLIRPFKRATGSQFSQEPFQSIQPPLESALLTRLSDIPQDQLYFPEPSPHFIPNETIADMLTGRRLLIDEVLGTGACSLENIHEHVSNGYIRYEAGILTKPRPACQRCGNEDPFLFGEVTCGRCLEACLYCRACLMMGRVTQCSPLLTWHGSFSKKEKGHRLGWEGQLSQAQERASRKLTEKVKNISGRTEFLIWAVCGAGKTEMLFPAIYHALNLGTPVLIATPRTDVVRELLPRLEKAFPNSAVKAFHGEVEAENRYTSAELVIATTHQVLRFHRHFPVVIIDEVDAFPYTYDEKLRFAVKNARAEESLTVYLTATPPNDLKRLAEKGALSHVKVPRRFHGHDLPVPKMRWTGNWKKSLAKKRLPYPVIQWLRQHTAHGKQIFLFVPRIDVMETIVQSLIAILNETKIDSVHSADPERSEKVSKFRQGAIRILVTTTILERGVTVKGVQVGVLGAEDGIFTESALVQIAGRAGRSPDEPDGDVIYFHYGKTKAMVAAVRHIHDMNREGGALS